MGVRGWCFIFKITTRIIFFKKILNKNLEILALNSKKIGDPSQTLCMYKLFPDPNPNPYVPSSIKNKRKAICYCYGRGKFVYVKAIEAI